ncbi:MAG: nickel pincer cofactor biosynthesis protein LarC, partial [Candidatus Eisenbacteria sp.]|nr:nickel pincer cofactor biosynthesis protein LarC [Candidatus Eisenbacteria bacterium]
AGVAGDMIVGALLDAGLALADLKRELSKLDVGGYSVEVRKTERNGISGTKFEVVTEEANVSRSAAEIVRIVEDSRLDEDVKRASVAILQTLARVEARIHNANVDEIHLHEVGGLDAIVDVVSSVAGLKLLGVDEVRASSIHVGTGFVECRHGTIPVPAPATLALLEGVPVVSRGIDAELATPTGVAIIRTLAAGGTGFGPMPAMRVETTGYGAGSRDLPIPNLLRVTIGQADSAYEADEVMLIETNIDDMSPEVIGYVCELLLSQGALDVYTTPVFMKKNRPGTLLSVLARPAEEDAVVATLFRETTTLGVRIGMLRRQKLERETVEIDTRFGPVVVKVSRHDGRIANAAPEYESVRKIALLRGIPLKDVYDEVTRAARDALDDNGDGGRSQLPPEGAEV